MEDELKDLYKRVKLLERLLRGVEIDQDVTFRELKFGTIRLLNDFLIGLYDKVSFIMLAYNKDAVDISIGVTVRYGDLMKITRENFNEFRLVPFNNNKCVSIEKKSVGEIFLNNI